jgi:DNA-binding transcriptional ArsR family regulator
MRVDHGTNPDRQPERRPVQLAQGQFERIAKALSDPRRFKLLQTIAESEHQCAYQKLCHAFPVTKATISHHLKELVTAGLVETERDVQKRQNVMVVSMRLAFAERTGDRANATHTALQFNITV